MTDRDPRPRLVVITGPVGAGKSSTGIALAHALRTSDQPVAVIDLDQMYGFVRQKDGYGEQTAWTRARLGAAALANALFTSGISIVIVERELFNPQELDTLLALIQPDVNQRFFTLQASYEQTLVRVNGDPSRGGSRDPATLRWLHDIFVRAWPFLQKTSIVIDTDSLTQTEVVARLVGAINDAPSLA